MVERKKDGIKFKISGIEDLGYVFKKPEKSIPTDRVDFSLIHKIEVQESEGFISFFLKPKYTYGKREPKLIAEFILKVSFEIENMSEVFEIDEEGNQSLPGGLVVTLFSISYSTLRGAFYEKSKGTMVERLIIPVINPSEALENSIISEEEPTLSEAEE